MNTIKQSKHAFRIQGLFFLLALFCWSACGPEEDTSFLVKTHSKADLEVMDSVEGEGDAVADADVESIEAGHQSEDLIPASDDLAEENSEDGETSESISSGSGDLKPNQDNQGKAESGKIKHGDAQENDEWGEESPGEQEGPLAEQPPVKEPLDEDETDLAEYTEEEVLRCASEFGVPASSIKLAGNQSNMNLTIGSEGIYAFKITGNQSVLELRIRGHSESLRGICIFAAGNQASIAISTTISIEKLVYSGKGNQSAAVISFLEEAILEYASIELSGNQAALTLNQSAPFSCPIPSVKGNASQFICE